MSEAARRHCGHVDKQGAPYIEHLTRVAAAVSPEAKPVALFHDAVEDGKATRQELAALLSETELAAVRLLTRDPEVPYADYIDQIAGAAGVAGALAREVKLADLGDNLGRLTPALEGLRGRYEDAVARLEDRRAASRSSHEESGPSQPG